MPQIEVLWYVADFFFRDNHVFRIEPLPSDSQNCTNICRSLTVKRRMCEPAAAITPAPSVPSTIGKHIRPLRPPPRAHVSIPRPDSCRVQRDQYRIFFRDRRRQRMGLSVWDSGFALGTGDFVITPSRQWVTGSVVFPRNGTSTFADSLQRRKLTRSRAGKALSIRASSASLSPRSPAPAFSAACSAFDALGIANRSGRRSRNRSVTWRGVRIVRTAQIGSLGAAVVLSGVLPVRAIFRFAGLFYVSVIAISLFTRGGLALLSVPGPEFPPGQCGWDSSDHHHRLKPEGLPPVINN